MSSAPAFVEVHRLNTLGRYAESLELLDSLEDSGIHLWLRGWALHHLGRTEEAHVALSRSEPLLTGQNLGRMLMDRAALYGHERQFARAYDLHVRAWQHGQGDAMHRTLVLYNLGWQHLSRLHLGQARARLFEAMEAGESLSGPDAPERMLTRTGLSTLERLSGQPEQALQRALWALEVPGWHRNERLRHRAQAQALRHLGELPEARAAQQRAVELSPPGPYRASEELLLGVLDRLLGRSVDLGALRADALPLDVVRLDLHLADEARLAGRAAEAVQTLRAVLALDEPYPVLDEAPGLPELFALGRAAGLDLPSHGAGRAERRVEVRALGVPELRVNGQPVPVTSHAAFALLTFVGMYGQSTLEVVADEVLPGVAAGQVRPRVRSALQVIARWLGDGGALKLQGNLLSLSPGWTVTVDASEVLAGQGRARGAFLPGRYSEWTGRVQDLLDAQARGEPVRAG